MPTQRRQVLHNIAGLSAGLLALNQTAPAQAAEPPSLAALREAGLDPLAVYIKMFASMTKGAECCWWFMGALPRDVQDVGAVDTIQEETVRIHRTEMVSADQIDFRWREVGIFRDIMTGEIPEQRFDPVTGLSKTGNTTIGGGASARVTVRKADADLSVGVSIPGNTTGIISVGATVDSGRVCLTHTEDKTRALSDGTPGPTNRTTFKIYANLSDLKGNAPNVPANGFYGVKNRDTGKIFVNGLVRKAALDEKVNPIAWNRLKAAHPSFFKDDRLAPSWEA